MTKELRSLPGLRQEFSHLANDYAVVKPFGPSILETYLPDDVLSSFLQLTDDLLQDPTRRSYGRHLVGQISEEPFIPNEMLEQYGILSYLKMMFGEYILSTAAVNAGRDYQREVAAFQAAPDYKNPVNIDIEAAWLVSQKGSEYNPIHNHSMATMSSVLYLKTPIDTDGEGVPGKAATDGDIEFVEGSTQPLQNATVRVSPKVGKFLIFPSYLLHLVYPFKGGSERRSVSINASHQ